MAHMANRIRDVRKSKHLTLEELAEKADISVSYLSRIEGGGRGLKLENAVKIARALSCDVIDITDEFAEEDIAHASSIGTATKRPLPEVGEQVPNFSIHAGLGNGGAISVEMNAETGFIPEEFVTGFWGFPEDVRTGFKKLSSIHALPVKGDSMEPTIPGGSTVFVDTTHLVPSPPDLYVVEFGDGLMVKRIELIPRTDKVRVISDNERYSSYELQRDELRVYGRVVASFQWRG